MSSPTEYIADRFPWLTRARAITCAFAVVLLIVFIWPHADVVTELVVVTAIPGLIGALIWGLTFWSKARVQIGRRQFRYKQVRRVAGIVAVACLPFLLMQRASIYLRSPREVVAGDSEAYTDTKDWSFRVVVAIAHLEGDSGNKLEGRLRDALAGLDPRLKVTPTILNRTIAVSSRPQGIAHLEALGTVGDIGTHSLIWGGAKGVAHPAVGPLYETKFGADPPFGGAFLPGDFRLPELPVDDLCAVLRLMVASQSADELLQWGFKFGDALEPLIKQMRAIADDPRKTAGWSADTRARVNLALGIATRDSGIELESEASLQRSISDFQRTLADWTRERDPSEWAMAQQNLGSSLRWLARQNLQRAPLRLAAASYKDALAVYESRSDRLDAARVQLDLGLTFEKMAEYETGAESLRQAADCYRAALKGFDVRYYSMSWVTGQQRLGRALNTMAHRDGDANGYTDAIAADREALKFLDKRSRPLEWAGASAQLAESFSARGELTENRDDLKKSIALLQQLLEGYPRQHDPAGWADYQIDLGNALLELYGIDADSGHQYLEPAEKAYRAALEELSLEHFPMGWANAKNGLGNALKGMGEIQSNTRYLGQAIDEFNDALKVFTPASNPVGWAWTKCSLGDALLDLGEQGSDVKYLKAAVNTYREALTVASKDRTPEQWHKIQNDLGIALDDLHKRGWDGS